MRGLLYIVQFYQVIPDKETLEILEYELSLSEIFSSGTKEYKDWTIISVTISVI